jgi:DNA-binding CsgD family transcriptional regulator
MIDDDTALDDLSRGYSLQEGVCRCLFCGEEYLAGDIYPIGARLVDAPTAARLHVEQAHGGVFEALLAGGKKSTGLTEGQSRMMALFYRGSQDREISAELGVSAAAVRFQRFHLREKARQARVFLALFALLERRAGRAEEPNIHKGATMVDERYMATDAEAQKIIAAFFTSLEPLKLKSLSSKEKKKLVILRVIAGRFEPGRRYAEREVDRVLRDIYDEDHVTLRRYLIEYGFLERTRDCGEYWVKG